MKKGNNTLTEYLNFVKKTDRLPKSDLSAVLHGLFGEVGGIMAAAKKRKREPESFTEFDRVVIEEFGDTFWYLCCLAGRLDVDIEKTFYKFAEETGIKTDVFFYAGSSGMSISYQPELTDNFDEILVRLGQLTGNFLNTEYVLADSNDKIYAFLRVFFDAVTLLNLDFKKIVSKNVEKASDRFIKKDKSELPTFDTKYEDFERLPDNFAIEFVKRTKTQQAMRWNGVFIGDPLTDSIGEDDGFRFHDVFHLSHAAILHWSPTFRSLIKHKRKSNPEVEEAQDSGRAIVVEEGLTAWIFTIAKENNFFIGRKTMTFDMLKNVGQIIKGFEVEECPLILWEEAIIKGYEVFRQVKSNHGGVVVGNRIARTIEYKNKL